MRCSMRCGIPGKVVVHDERAELQVDAFRRRFRGDHHRGVVTEMFDQGGAAVNGTRAGHTSRACVGFDPTVEDLPG